MPRVTRSAWRGTDNPVFRQLFTAQFVPEASPQQIEWFNDLCRRTTTPELATRLFRVRGQVDVRALLPLVRAPTLVLHARHDEMVPFDAGKYLAAEIPSAEFVRLDSRNHIILPDEPAWERFKDAVLEFTGRPRSATAEDPLLAKLSPRERLLQSRRVSSGVTTEATFVSNPRYLAAPTSTSQAETSRVR
jgi:hypothetical protein